MAVYTKITRTNSYALESSFPCVFESVDDYMLPAMALIRWDRVAESSDTGFDYAVFDGAGLEQARSTANGTVKSGQIQLGIITFGDYPHNKTVFNGFNLTMPLIVLPPGHTLRLSKAGDSGFVERFSGVMYSYSAEPTIGI